MQYVYLLRAGDKHYKVGISHNVKSRVSGLQSHNPEHIDIITTKFADTEAYTIEQELHKKLEDMKATGANEWFALTPEQALELCITIQQYPDPDISERVTMSELVRQVRHNQKAVDRKLDYVINTYQKHIPIPKPEVKIVRVIETPKIVPEKPDKVEKFDREDDDHIMLEAAIKVVQEAGKASTSMLQRKLKIGYGRAARFMDEMEEQGIVSPQDGPYPRQVLTTLP